MQISEALIYGVFGFIIGGASVWLILWQNSIITRDKANRKLQRDLEVEKRRVKELEHILERQRLESVKLKSSLEQLIKAYQKQEEREEEYKEAQEYLNNSLKQSRDLLEEERVKSASLQMRLEALEELLNKMGELEDRLSKEREYNLSLERELSAIRAKTKEESEQNAIRIKELKEAREAMAKEFENLSSRIIERNSHSFSEISTSKIEAILEPMKEQMRDFRQRIEQVHTQESKEVATLMQEIKHLRELNSQISKDAKDLTNALKGDTKKQGIWGEIVLERVLEASGLRKGKEYEREVTMLDNQNRRFRPDVIIHLPNKRDVIIDAKTSLIDYEKYVNAKDDNERKLFAKRHLEAIKSHIKRLSEKDYSNLKGVNTLDFIFMFMPIEGALITL